MKYLGAYLLAVLGGKESPTADDIKEILQAGGIEIEDDILDVILPRLEGKSVHELISEGYGKFAACGGGGGGGGGGSRPPVTSPHMALLLLPLPLPERLLVVLGAGALLLCRQRQRVRPPLPQRLGGRRRPLARAMHAWRQGGAWAVTQLLHMHVAIVVVQVRYFPPLLPQPLAPLLQHQSVLDLRRQCLEEGQQAGGGAHALHHAPPHRHAHVAGRGQQE